VTAKMPSGGREYSLFSKLLHSESSSKWAIREVRTLFFLPPGQQLLEWLNILSAVLLLLVTD
jgi:hypothetical protein